MLNQKQSLYWRTFWLCALGAALMFLPFLIVDKGLFLYAGDFNSQQIPFYYYANEFVKNGGGSFSWATDLGSGFLNSYSFYLLGSPFWWLSLAFPAAWLPYLMVPLLILKFAVAGAGAQLWLRRWVKNQPLTVLGGVLYAFSGFTIYNVFFNHFVDAVALFPYLLWALDEAVLKKRRGPFALLVALNLLNNYFFFAGQVVFLLIYFICMNVSGSYQWKWKTFWALAAESLLGCGMGCILAIPAVLFLADNPRTIDPFSGYGFLLYGQSQQYAAILYNLFFPPDSPYMPVLFDKGVIKWNSLSAYLPMVSCVGVVAYLRCKKDTAFKKILYTCLVMAMIPVLNSSFYALNSSYYARWYYMPVLIMCAATLKALEDGSIDLEKGFRPVLAVMLAFCAFVLVPVKGKDDEGWTVGVADYPEKFWLNLGLAVLGVAVFWMIWLRLRNRDALAKRLCAAALAFGCVIGFSHIAIGKFAQWDNDSSWREQQYVDARALAEKLPEGAYRVDEYGCYDNVGLWMGRSCLQFFNSTVAPSIMEFYPQHGYKRDVRSVPKVENYALRSLLGVKYTICDEADKAEFEKKTENRWELKGQLGELAVYENPYALPFAFTYDSYVTTEEYMAVSENRRANLLMRAVVLDEEQVEEYGSRLTPLDESARSNLDKENFRQDAERRKEMSAWQVDTDSSGLTAYINLKKDDLVFFAVPYDKGFEAVVNGEEAPVLKVSGGLMAVPAPAGETIIRLEYHTPGLTMALVISGASLVLYLAYLAAQRRRPKPKEN